MSLLVNPHYCPEDKDVLDFIRSVAVPVTALVLYMRKRGVYVSKDASREDLALLAAKESFTWPDVTELLALVTEPLKKEHYVTGNHDSEASFEVLEQATANVRTHRLTKYGDRVTIAGTGTNEYRITIEYTDTFYEKTRLIQSVERDAEILIQRTANGFKTRRSADHRAKEVELAILGEFERLAKEADKKVASRRILLSLLPDLASRVRFFTSLMEGIDGFAFEQIASVRVQSVLNVEAVHDSEEDDEVAKEYASSIESLMINGRNVGNTTLYDELIGKDFFPIAATWTVVSDTDDYRKVEIRAGFIPELNDFELQFSVSGVWRGVDGAHPKEKPNTIVSSRLAELISQSAEKALANERDAEGDK